ncbi:MAG: ribokinase [Opitutales bacterium]|nr:ribokinase [Opitutales bacterium]
MSARPARITVVGSANIDFTMQVGRLPGKGETVLDGRFRQVFGGKGANQAVAAARAGAVTAWVGATGDDSLSGELRAALAADGLHLDSSVTIAGARSGAAMILLDAAGENHIAVDSGSNAALRPEHIDAAEPLIASSDWVVLQMEIPTPANLRALDLATRHRIPALLNFAPATTAGFPLDDRVTGLVVNEAEASFLSHRPIADAPVPGVLAEAEALRKRGGHAFVVVTLGARGAVFTRDGSSGHVPSFPANVMDTTGAGDTFCGYLATALAEGLCLGRAVRLASAAAALAVSRAGAQPSIPGRRETADFLAATDPG